MRKGTYLRVSGKGYNTKPTAEDMKEITYNISNKECYYSEYEEIGHLLGLGCSILLGKYKDGSKSILEPNIEYLECIALDIDSKENPITLFEMQSLIFKKFGALPVLAYPTFSDMGYTRFRLIYRFQDKIDSEVYKLFYKALIWKFKKYLDGATCNANRIWAGTDKKVIYNDSDIPFSTSTIVKLINAHDSAIKRKQKKVEIKKTEEYIKFENEDYIKPEFKQDVLNSFIKNIDIADFIIKHFGWSYKTKGDIMTGRCPLPNHAGDGSNEEAFVVFKNTNTFRCFTHCGSGNIFTLAKYVYNTDNFSQLAFALANEYNLEIDDQHIRRIRND